MHKIREYEKWSLECTELAESAPNPAIRAQYLKLAHMWRRLAEERRTFLQIKSLE
jgi:hypothetical protein